MNNNIIDYTASLQTYTYRENGCKYAFTIYDDYYPEANDGDDAELEFTGNKKVIAVTPDGTIFLTITKENGLWEPDQEYLRNNPLTERINAVLISRIEFEEAHV